MLELAIHHIFGEASGTLPGFSAEGHTCLYR